MTAEKRDARKPLRRTAASGTWEVAELVPKKGSAMTVPREQPLPLSHLGQEFRKRGLGLDTGRLRKAVEAGDAVAERRGCRWYMYPEAALPFARPIREPAPKVKPPAA